MIQESTRVVGGGAVCDARQRVHLVGIGGTGLAGLARMYLDLGFEVSGSDVSVTGTTVELQGLGATIFGSHDEEHVRRDLDRLVLSAAIPETNPEWVRARSLGIRVEKYSEALASLVREREAIAVAGTHGKTTVTAWVAHLLRCAGRDVGYLVGGRPLDLEASGHVGRDPAVVVEACEYDRTFLRLRPSVAVINNIEEDHLDYYSGIDEILGAFRDFACRIRPGGVLAAPGDVLRGLRLPDDLPVTILSAGIAPESHVRGEDLDLERGHFAFTLYLGAYRVGRVRLGLPGDHNVRNAVSVAAVGFALGIDTEVILRALSGFRGVMRRIERVGEYRGVPVLDDYAHHPTEVRASLRAVRDAFPERRIWVVFQPHQYSRTRRFLDRFSRSFDGADRIVVTEIFRAREAVDPSLSGEALAGAIRKAGGDAVFVAELEDVVSLLRKHLEPADLVLTMGAGDVTKVSHEIVA